MEDGEKKDENNEDKQKEEEQLLIDSDKKKEDEGENENKAKNEGEKKDPKKTVICDLVKPNIFDIKDENLWEGEMFNPFSIK